MDFFLPSSSWIAFVGAILTPLLFWEHTNEPDSPVTMPHACLAPAPRTGAIEGRGEEEIFSMELTVK